MARTSSDAKFATDHRVLAITSACRPRLPFVRATASPVATARIPQLDGRPRLLRGSGLEGNGCDDGLRESPERVA